MSSRIQLTARDEELLRTLTSAARGLTPDQVARTWWPGGRIGAMRRATVLAHHGFLLIDQAPAHPELDLFCPELTWKPGEPCGDLGALSYRLQSRWVKHPVMTTVVAASKRSANIFGGHGGRLPREVERTHDIHLGRVYLLYRLRIPSILSSWVFEEEIRKERGQTPGMVPDAIIRSGSSSRAIEFGGAYGKGKLERFHRFCEAHNLSYEVW